MASNDHMGESPGGKPMGPIGVGLITVYFVLVAIVVIHSLVVLWPPNREPSDLEDRLARIEKALGIPQEPAEATGAEGETGQPEETPAPPPGSTEAPLTSDVLTTDALTTEPMTSGELTTAGPGGEGTPAGSSGGSGGAQEAHGECGEQSEAELFWFLPLCLSEEERLFLVVLFAGALGGLVHSLRSFYWYLGNRKLVLSWAGMYITLPVLGACLATVFYLVIRGGFFSPQSQISDTSPFGFAALAALIGMFTEQAVEKLKQVSETLLSPAPKGKNTAGPAPTLTGASPSSGPQAGGTTVTLTGKDFVQGATVTFGGQAGTNVQVVTGGASLTVDTPAAAATGPVTVEVINSDQQKASLPNGFTYT